MPLAFTEQSRTGQKPARRHMHINHFYYDAHAGKNVLTSQQKRAPPLRGPAQIRKPEQAVDASLGSVRTGQLCYGSSNFCFFRLL